MRWKPCQELIRASTGPTWCSHRVREEDSGGAMDPQHGYDEVYTTYYCCYLLVLDSLKRVISVKIEDLVKHTCCRPRSRGR